MNQQAVAAQAFDPADFPHIDLSELSCRPGVDGPRYVLMGDGRSLGDTNTGRCVFSTRNFGVVAPVKQPLTRAQQFAKAKSTKLGNGEG